MSDEYVDPSGNTEAFRSFQSTPPAAEPAPSKLPLIIGVAVGVVVLAILIAFIALG